MIYAFGHRSRVGKDTCVGFLDTDLRIRDISVRKVSFAFELKMSCHHLFGYLGVEHPVHYENHPEDRDKIIPGLGMNVVDLWIRFGNDMRAIKETIWIDLALKQDDGTADVILISDCRFPNEADAVHHLGGKVYKVIRPDAPILDSPSDRALVDYEGWDGMVLNTGKLDRLQGLMEGLANEIEQQLQ